MNRGLILHGKLKKKLEYNFFIQFDTLFLRKLIFINIYINIIYYKYIFIYKI